LAARRVPAIFAYRVGKRDTENTMELAHDLRERVNT
jgi:hypothetical protein